MQTISSIPSSRHFTLLQVEAFVAVAECQSFSHAAGKLGVSQPSVSRAIRDLEDATGYTLFERTPNGARLSARGAAFLPKGKELLAAHGEAVAALPSWRSSQLGHFSLAGSVSVMPVLMPVLRRNLRREFGRATINVVDGLSSQVQREVLEGKAALGVCSDVEFNSGFRTSLVLEAQLGLLLPRDLQLPDEITGVEDLATVPFVRYADDALISRLLKRHEIRFDAYFRSALAVTGVASALDLVQREKVAIVASGINASNVGAAGLRFLPLPGVLPVVQVCIVSRRGGECPAQERLRDILGDSIRETAWHPSVKVVRSARASQGSQASASL